MILARHGMLECGANFKGTIPEMCRHCDKKDNENHRLNECTHPNLTNWANSDEQIEFCSIYSNDNDTVTRLIERTECIWEIRYGNGSIKRV